MESSEALGLFFGSIRPGSMSFGAIECHAVAPVDIGPFDIGCDLDCELGCNQASGHRKAACLTVDLR